MRWGKTVLIFQAVITLVIGMAFFIQVIKLDTHKISELKVELKQGIIFGDENKSPQIVDLKARYSTATYILLIIGMIELLILTRLMD